MPRKTHIRWNTIATLITLAVLLSAGGRVMAFLQGGGEPAEAPLLLAQVGEPGAEHEEAALEHGAAGEEEHGVLAEVFHWMNFILIAAGVWYLGKKIAGPLFAERTRAIQEHMRASARAMEEASKRLAGIELKLQNLNEEIRDIRLTAERAAAAEQARMEELAQTEAGKIAHAAEQEIETAAKAARRELQKYSAELAIGLAEKRIRDTISPDAEKRILRSFVSDLGDGGGRS
jgi:F-type H+-transporting ATPase subunit b